MDFSTAQSGNSYRDQILIKLNDTKLTGSITHNKFVCFLHDAEIGDILKPHFELTSEKLASYNFYPNASIIYALELLNHVNRK
ncbi:hypothetical protein LJE82_16370 [bacterium BMS3Abin03]|jgi:hypothetical protein|nr:hypothetical protein [bacterium BMS3Abin03]